MANQAPRQWLGGSSISPDPIVRGLQQAQIGMQLSPVPLSELEVQMYPEALRALSQITKMSRDVSGNAEKNLGWLYEQALRYKQAVEGAIGHGEPTEEELAAVPRRKVKSPVLKSHRQAGMAPGFTREYEGGPEVIENMRFRADDMADWLHQIREFLAKTYK